MTDDEDPAWTKERCFGGGLDDVIIMPLALVALATRTILGLILSLLMRLLDDLFPLAMQVARLPLIVARVIGAVVILAMSAALGLVPVSEGTRRRWRMVLRRGWSRLRRKTSYRALERAVSNAVEGGMAWLFRKCRHLSPTTAFLVILGAALWLPVSFAIATAMHALLLSKVASWPAWTQLLHVLATVIAKSKLLVLPAYPAAWPQARRHPLVQRAFNAYDAVKRMHVVRKASFRYWQAEIAAVAAAFRLKRIVGVGSAMRWMGNAHMAERLGVKGPLRRKNRLSRDGRSSFRPNITKQKSGSSCEGPILDWDPARVMRPSRAVAAGRRRPAAAWQSGRPVPCARPPRGVGDA